MPPSPGCRPERPEAPDSPCCPCRASTSRASLCATAAAPCRLGVERLRGRVRLLPLVGGRIELTELSLFNPRLVHRDDGSADETLRRLATVLTPGGGTFNLPDVERLVLFNGRVETIGAGGDQSIPLDGIQLVAGRGMSRDTYDLNGELVWRGERVKFQSFALDVAALMEGRQAATSGRISGDIGAIDFAGRVTRLPAWDAEGKLSVKTNSLRRMASWLALPMPMAVEGPIDLQGAVRLRDGDVSLASAAVVLPAGRLEGALHLKDIRGRASLSGTLAGDKLDLTRAGPLAGRPARRRWRLVARHHRSGAASGRRHRSAPLRGAAQSASRSSPTSPAR